jgi:Tfp pilus assembly protein PilO
VVILLAGIAMLYVGVAAPVLDVFQQREAMLATDRLLAPRLQAAAAEVPHLLAQVAELRQAASTRKFSLDGTSDSLASASLQSRIEELAAAAGIAIASTEGLPPETRGIYHRLGLRIAVSGSYEHIVNLLSAIEVTTPPLVIDNLQIHGNSRISASPVTAQLDASFVVYGFRNNETPTAAKP